MAGCLFCNIVAKTTSAQVIFEDAFVIAIRDIRPVAPIHVLVIPKAHIVGIHEAKPEHVETLGRVLLAARDVAEQLGLASGYRLVINQGPDAGQSVLHLHCHVLGGRPMAWPPG